MQRRQILHLLSKPRRQTMVIDPQTHATTYFRL